MPLEALLDQAAAALMAGDLAALARLTPEIEAARIAPTDRASAERLEQKARRNARLRMSEIARGPTFTTYDARGHKAEIAPAGLTPARRV